MEVRHQNINHTESERRIYEKARVSLSWDDLPVTINRGFKSSNRTGSHSDDSPPLSPDTIDGFGSLERNFKCFLVHVVFFDFGCPNRQKCPDSNVKGQGLDRNPHSLDFGDQGGSEMKSRCGSGDRAILPGKDGLIALPILPEIDAFSPLDVRWQGNLSDPLEDPSEVSSGTESDGPNALDAG